MEGHKIFPLPGLLTQQVPIAIAPTPNVYWPMQEGTGTTFTDTIASMVATLNGATWSVAGGRNGTNCLNFATGQWAYIADPFFYDPMTVCAWIYPTTTFVYKVIMSKRNDINGSNQSNGPEMELFLDTGNRVNFKRWDTTSHEAVAVVGTTSVPANQWSHVAGSSGGDLQTGYVYLNGVIDGSATQAQVSLNTTSAFMFGGRTSNLDARYYLGKMQEVRVYNYRLSETEMGAVFNAPPP